MRINIFILTGKVGTGKTSSLMSLVKSQNNLSGILQPVIDGKRFIYFIDADEKMELELEASTNRKCIDIGKYKFDITALEWAKGSLRFVDSLNPKILIIDEFGKLELQGRGLEPVVSQIIDERRNENANTIILVVRDYLVEQAVEYLNLREDEYKTISKEQLKTLINQL